MAATEQGAEPNAISASKPTDGSTATTRGAVSMRAIVQDAYGSADVLHLAEIDAPDIAANEVLVKVHAAGMDRGTWHFLTGKPYLMRIMGFGFRGPKNRVAGLDVAGTVVAVGADVTRFQVGDEVFGISRGSFAEYAAAREDKLARKPAGLSFEQAAVVPISGGTAIQGSARRAHRGGTAGADHRCVGRRRHLRRATRQGPRSRGDRCVQHREARSRPLDRRRPCHRLHPGGLRRRRTALRPDPRHRREQPSVAAPSGTRSQGDARHRRRRRGRAT